jgi:hypothetical protein
MNSPVFPALNRPQYVANPELFQSSLAWSIVGNSQSAYIYERIVETKKNPDWWVITRPRAVNDAEDWNRWLREVKTRLLPDHMKEEHARDSARAILSAIEGIQQSKGVGKTAVPITFHAALLQNARGVMGVRQPPNFSSIVDSLYALGGTDQDETASLLWNDAIHDFNEEGTLANLDAAIKAGLKPYPDDVEGHSPQAEGSLSPAPAWLHRAKESSPFHWFHDAWNKITGEDWRNALPPRRWCDWATCVLRTALGTCYLWEARFYREIAEGLVGSSLEPEVIARKAVSRSSPMLTWKHRGPISTRDVASHIKSIVRTGLNAMRFLREELVEEFEDLGNVDPEKADSLVDWISRCRNVLDTKRKDRLDEALQEPWAGRHKNTYETIVYSLLCREPLGAHADHYAMLVKRGSRYTLVDPSPEWPVVVASLACPSPGMPTRLGQVRRNLRQLGLSPTYDTLIHSLESAGLCQSSHDADEAIEVIPGF